MIAGSLNGADKLVPDLAMSSDEEEFASGRSAASIECETTAKKNLTLALGKLRLEQEDLSRASLQKAPITSRPGPSQTPPAPKMAPLQLLDLPLDVLKEIIKEVIPIFPAIMEIAYDVGTRSHIRMT